MSNEKLISYLKKQYLDKIRPLQTVNEVINIFKNKMDITQIKESDLSELEEPHFKFLRFNYRNNIDVDITKADFIFFMIQKNERSKQYYDLMQNELERIIIVIEPKSNLIASNCDILSLDLQIERGIDEKYVELETSELIAYLSYFEFRKSLS